MDANLDELIHIDRLTDWLDANIPQLGSAPLACSLLHGGTSNVVVQLDRGEGSMVLRRPPAVPPPGSEKGILREARVLDALNQTIVPHPICHGVCDDLDVIGGRFYVMEKVKGWAPTIVNEKVRNIPPFDDPVLEYRLPFAVVDGLVALANVDHKAIGLEDFGKPGKFLERQVDRWASQLGSYKEKYGYAGRKLDGYELLEDWLRNNIPADEVMGIIHGDVGTPNMMFHFDRPARLAAMLDWELSTIGDPMIDMGWFTGSLRDEYFPDRKPSFNIYDPDRFPTRQELGRYYCAGTGRNPADLDYFTLLAQFKAICIMEYKVAQAEANMIPKEIGTMHVKIVDEKLKKSVDLIKKIS